MVINQADDVTDFNYFYKVKNLLSNKKGPKVDAIRNYDIT